MDGWMEFRTSYSPIAKTLLGIPNNVLYVLCSMKNTGANPDDFGELYSYFACAVGS